MVILYITLSNLRFCPGFSLKYYCVPPICQMMTLQVWTRILDANLTGAFLTTHYSWPLLARDAHLFYLSATSERLRLPGLGANVTAKGRLENFAEVVRKESKRKITVVRPSAVDTTL